MKIEDFQDLPFDISRHAEAFKSFVVLNLLPESIRPTLRARDLIFVRVPACRFQIGVTEDFVAQERIEIDRGSIVSEVVYQSETAADAMRIRDEVERYFLCHYPGRTMHEVRTSGDRVFIAQTIYVACYPPKAETE